MYLGDKWYQSGVERRAVSKLPLSGNHLNTVCRYNSKQTHEKELTDAHRVRQSNTRSLTQCTMLNTGLTGVKNDVMKEINVLKTHHLNL